MAAPTGTFTTGAAIGQREDLHNKIWMLDKDEFPFQQAVGSGVAEATYTEWQTDTLGNGSSTNYNLEGDDSTAVAVTPTVRVGNRTQILKKPFTVSGTMQAVRLAGRPSEVGMQTMKQGRQIKMDLETSLLINQASGSESGATPRKMGGLLSWLTSNVSRGSGGTSGGFSGGNTTAAGNGTQRTFTETLLKVGIKSAWDNGGRPRMIMVNSNEKQVASGFTGIATQYNPIGGKIATIVGAIDRYVSDFGTLSLVANRYVSTRDAIGFDPAYAKVRWLRKFKRETLAQTGDAQKYHLVGEATLEVSNEAAHFVIADLT